jgi:hypothetical protein
MNEYSLGFFEPLKEEYRKVLCDYCFKTKCEYDLIINYNDKKCINCYMYINSNIYQCSMCSLENKKCMVCGNEIK